LKHLLDGKWGWCRPRRQHQPCVVGIGDWGKTKAGEGQALWSSFIWYKHRCKQRQDLDEVSDQKIPKFFGVPHGSIQAGQVDAVEEKMEFYYRKGGRGLQLWSLLGGMEALHTGKIGGKF
jgi:hypothetical protein